MMAPAGAEHGDVAAELLVRIRMFAKSQRLGKTYAAETGFTISRNPDTTRAPDVGFVKQERVRQSPERGFFEGAPDLAVEVVSPSDRAVEVMAQVDEWLGAGALSVWVVNPQGRSIEVYRHGREVLRYLDADVLRDEPALPGFELKLSDVFDTN